MKAAYLTHSLLKIFDDVERKDPDFEKIVDGLKISFARSVPQKDRILLDSGSLNFENLKAVLGDLVKDDKIKKFVKACRVEMGLEKKEEDMGYTKRQSEKQWDDEEEGGKNLIKFTDDFWIMLDKIKNDPMVWDLYSLDSNPDIKNPMKIQKVDISDKEWYFDIVSKGKSGRMKVTQFCRSFFPKADPDDIYDFAVKYNRLISGVSGQPKTGKIIQPRRFEFEPTNVRETFISLVTETYPHGHEDEVVKYLPEGLEKDEFGNYYAIIGDSDTVFTCHLDTVDRTKSKVGLVAYKKDNQDFIKTDGRTILGADDKSGVAILMYMMAKGIEGVYWFFNGEERGGIGSGKVAENMEKYPFMEGKKKMISFDRRNYYSVITEQMGITCCSNEFGESLCSELNKNGLKLNLDPTGVFTDSANFIELIPECTNVSVGYFNEHTSDEVQNITYLENLAKACSEVDWSKLTVKRKIGFDEEVARKYAGLIRQYKKLYLYNSDSIKGIDGRLVFDIEVTDSDLDHFYKDMLALQKLFTAHKLDPDFTFDEDHIKIELE